MYTEIRKEYEMKSFFTKGLLSNTYIELSFKCNYTMT